MASIRKRGGAYLIIVSMGYDHEGKRRPPQQKTVHPPDGLTAKQTDKWLREQATLFEMTCKNIKPRRNPNTTLAEYTEIWLRDIAPTKLAKSTVIRERQDTERFLPVLGGYKLAELSPDHFRKLYADMRRKNAYAAPMVRLDRGTWCNMTGGMVHGNRGVGAAPMRVVTVVTR